MSLLLVTPRAHLEEAIANFGPSHIVSLLSPDHMIPTPAGFPAERHLKLGVNDITDPADGTDPPSRAHIEALLAFSREWKGEVPLLIHCWAGISRSMASAFTVLCDRIGPGSEMGIAQAMRRRAPHAMPNRLLVSHADALLNRDGRMLNALDGMGPPSPLEEGVAGITAVFPLEGL